jgi:3-oxoacyl-[acyl-carrier protein] reductase
LPAKRRSALVSQLRGKVALITGANRGIGLAIARALASEGCNLIITARDEPTLKKIGRELAHLKVRVLVHACDVRDPVAVKALLAAVERKFHRLDILINNAGIAHPSRNVDNFRSNPGSKSSIPT